MPEKVSVTLEIVVPKVNFNDPIVSPAIPIQKERHFTLARGVDHATGHHKSSDTFLVADKGLIGSENHVFQARSRVDGYDFVSAFPESGAKGLPLGTCFGTVHRGLSRHVGILPVNDVKIP